MGWRVRHRVRDVHPGREMRMKSSEVRSNYNQQMREMAVDSRWSQWRWCEMTGYEYILKCEPGNAEGSDRV